MAYGHLYVQYNEPAIAPLAEAKPNTEVFRLLARKMELEAELFDVSDEQLAAESLIGGGEAGHYPPPEGFVGITLDRLRKEGPIRVKLPKDLARSRRAASTRRRASASSTARALPSRGSIRCRRTRRRTRIRRRNPTWRQLIRCN